MLKMIRRKFLYSIIILFISTIGFAQHRGDNLAFQGTSITEGNGVKALAMGGAYSSISGGVQSIFWNPAGLVATDKIQITFQGNSYDKMWRENQVYRPFRQFVVMSFILDGLYTPDPAFNGMYDYEVFNQDSSYSVDEPLLGEDYYSEKAADWQKEKNEFVFDNFALAVPFKISGKPLVVSAAYNKRNQVLDYDRNHTYLLPHLGYTPYEGIIDRVSNPDDSIRVYWSDYERQRTGTIWNLSTAFAIEMNQHLKLGFGFNKSSGETDDMQKLDRVGYFDLVEANEFRFSYDTLGVKTEGVSTYDAMSFNIGAILDFKYIDLGFKITPPYTLTREWEYTTIESNNTDQISQKNSGKDELSVPMSFSAGISIQPIEQFRIAFDLQRNNYSQAEFSLANNDSTHRGWSNQQIIGVGIEYIPWEWISVLGGYRNTPEVFIPDGAPIKDRGPFVESITLGLSIKALYGWFDIAYETRKLKYYDSYFSNTNYAMETLNRVIAGYTFSF